jgi:hypothetical protein
MPAFAAIASIPIGSGPTNVYAPPVPIVVRPAGCFGYRTAGDIASSALKLILVEAGDSPLEPDEYADALMAMNDMMASLEADGVRLGYARVCNVTDIVTVPDGAFRGVIANLALECAPMYGGKVSATLVKQAMDGMKTLYKYGVHVGQSLYPRGLPLGSANQFYNNESLTPYASMTLNGNRRQTVMVVAGGAEKAQGVWTVGPSHGLAPDVSGRITNKGEKQTFTLSVDLAITADADIGTAIIGITRNAQFVMFTESALSETPTRIVLNGSVELERDQYLDIVMTSVYTTTSITLTDGVVSLA